MEANALLKTLGVGVDLDLTKAAEAQIKKTLDQMIKLAEAHGRKQQEASRQASDGIRDTAKHYSEAMQTIQKVTTKLDGNLETVGKRIEGINKQGMKTILTTDADGFVTGGTQVPADDAEMQRKTVAEVNALYRQQETQLRAIAALRDSITGSRNEQETTALQSQIQERERLILSIREEIAAKATGMDTSRQDASLSNLQRELA